MNEESLTPKRLIKIADSRLFVRGLICHDPGISLEGPGHIQILIIAGEWNCGTSYYTGWFYEYFQISANHKHFGVPIRFNSMTQEEWLKKDAFLRFLNINEFWKRNLPHGLGLYNFPKAWISSPDEKLIVQRHVLGEDKFKDELVPAARLNPLIHFSSLQGIFSQKYFSFKENEPRHLLEWKVYKRINGFLNEQLEKWDQVIG